MNPQLGVVTNRQFWTGVGATIAVVLLVAMGVPNLLRSRVSLNERASYPARARVEGYIDGGGGGGGDREKFVGLDLIAGNQDDRKMIRSASMELVVRNPREISEKIRLLAEQSGGFLVSSEINGGESASSASLTVRVPVGRFEQVRSEIARLGVRIESEKLEAEDVTKRYVDLSARLRNLHAQETQYLGILKQAKTVKDTVDVSEKLNDVRAQVEQQQAEFDALSKQVETVALSISLRAEADAQIFGLHWRPLYRLKLAARDGIDGIGDYASTMASFFFYIPAVILWLATILIAAAVGWRVLKWAGRTLFVKRAKKA